MDQTLPSWATQLRNRYLSGESSVFLLHGNVRDVQPWMEPDGKVVYLALRDFLTRFLGRSKEPVVHYNVSEGLEFGARGRLRCSKRPSTCVVPRRGGRWWRICPSARGWCCPFWRT